MQGIIEKIEEYAGLYMSIADIATLIDYNVDELRSRLFDRETPESIAYYRAKVQAKLEHHRIEKQLAEMGNPESAKRIAGYMLEQDDSE